MRVTYYAFSFSVFDARREWRHRDNSVFPFLNFSSLDFATHSLRLSRLLIPEQALSFFGPLANSTTRADGLPRPWVFVFSLSSSAGICQHAWADRLF